MYKKHFFTLIEVIISLSLITVIITLLFGYFAKITKVEHDIEDIKKIVYQKSTFQIRLNNIFSQLHCKNYNQCAFYTEYEKNKKYLSLYINFDNGIDPDPNYSDIIKAKIHLDENNNLILEMFSKDKKTKITRKEVLFNKIKNFECKFLSYNDLEAKSYIKETITNNESWYNFWPEKSKNLPLVIKITLNNNLDFAFFLPSQSAKI